MDQREGLRKDAACMLNYPPQRVAAICASAIGPNCGRELQGERVCVIGVTCKTEERITARKLKYLRALIKPLTSRQSCISYYDQLVAVAPVWNFAYEYCGERHLVLSSA